MFIRYGYEITISCRWPTAMVAMLQLREGREDAILSEEVFRAEPEVPTRLYRDLFGNLCRRFTAPAGDTTFASDGIMEVSDLPEVYPVGAQQHPVADLPDECLVYLMGSRYCETDRLSQLAWDLFGPIAPGWDRVQAISDFVHRRIDFDYQKARATRTAHEAYQERTGVCRDYAHLAIALCRCMNIPARYVNGYLGDIQVPLRLPMDFSAWMEVYLSGEWRAVDPRNNMPRIGRIAIAHGRDAADVAMLTSFGPHLLKKFYVWAEDVQAPDFALMDHGAGPADAGAAASDMLVAETAL